MADQPAGEKTEEPTEQRLRKARDEGQLPNSQEVPSALMIGALVLLLIFAGPVVARHVIAQCREGLMCQVTYPMDIHGYKAMLLAKGQGVLRVLAPFLVGGAVISVLASLVSSGWAFSPKGVKLKAENINPVKGLKRMFSWKSLVKLLVSLAKLGIIGGIVWDYLSDRQEMLLMLNHATAMEMAVTTGRLVCGVMVRIVIGLVVVAIIDMIYQRFSYKKQLKMTRQEVKEEHRQYNVSPELKQRMRGIQTSLAQKRMLQDVPEADVVVTNPTHFAVALKYDPGAMEAPRVVAKGADLLCQRIKDLARDHDVPIVERPPLARALYASAEIGQEVPPNLFVAVAEVLAMVYKLRNRRRSRPATESK